MARFPGVQACGHWRPTDRAIRLESHRNPGLELVSIATGGRRWQVGGVVEDVPPGSLFFTLPWQDHGSAEPWEPGSDLSWIVLQITGGEADWRFHRDLGLHTSPAEDARLRRAFSISRHSHPAGPLVARLLPEAVDRIKATDAGTANPLLLRGLITALVAAAADAVSAGAAQAADDPNLVRVRAWISAITADPTHDDSLEAMAASCGLGRTRFAELVQTATGDSPIRYRNRQRVAMASRLLSTSRRDITTIAIACGFSSSQYFARVFRSFTGMEPSAWRDRR
jgi:AraC family L-rhamnose operon regulatory protein RhaS